MYHNNQYQKSKIIYYNNCRELVLTLLKDIHDKGLVAKIKGKTAGAPAALKNQLDIATNNLSFPCMFFKIFIIIVSLF